MNDPRTIPAAADAGGHPARDDGTARATLAARQWAELSAAWLRGWEEAGRAAPLPAGPGAA